LLRYYVWTPGAAGYVDELLLIGRPGSGGVRVALRDRMYNVIALVGWGVPNLTERYEYNPYGERIVLDSDYTLDADGESDFTNPLGHQGLRHDAATGLIHNRARMRDPVRARWLQRDPLGYVDGASLYAAYHIMSGRRDPSGLICCRDKCKTVGTKRSCRVTDVDIDPRRGEANKTLSDAAKKILRIAKKAARLSAKKAGVIAKTLCNCLAP